MLVKQLFIVKTITMPYQLLIDHDLEFGSDLFLEMCSCLEIDQIRTLPYRPTCNKMLKRYHTTLHSMLWKIVSENKKLGHQSPVDDGSLIGFCPRYYRLHTELLCLRKRGAHVYRYRHRLGSAEGRNGTVEEQRGVRCRSPYADTLRICGRQGEF